jgi:hypothetical protein
MGMKKYTASPTATLVLGLFFTTTIPIAVDAIINTVASLVSPAIGNLSFTIPAMGQPDVLTKKQSDAFSAYNNAVSDFESILGQRRAQINSNKPLPNLPGQALYLARICINKTWRDSTISTMTMNERHIVLTHFPCLLNVFFSTSVCTISEG